MKSINILNKQYEEKLDQLDKFNDYRKAIININENGKLDDFQKIVQSISVLGQMKRSMDKDVAHTLEQIISLATQYVRFYELNDSIKHAVQNSNWSKVTTLSGDLKETRRLFVYKQKKFESEYKYSIQNSVTLYKYLQCLFSATEGFIKKSIDDLKDKTFAILNQEISVNLRETDPINTSDILPEEILIARNPIRRVDIKLLKDMGVEHFYNNIYADFKHEGNIILSTDNVQLSNAKIDEFVVAYILRVLDSFPLGTVNVHIFSKNINYLYLRLVNCFNKENTGEETKRIIQLHTDLKDLSYFNEVTCRDIVKKIGVDVPDLYSVYKKDRTDVFNLIVLREGLISSNSYSTGELTSLIAFLSKPNELGHKCGLRFFIVDDSAINCEKINLNEKNILDSILANCGLKIQYNDGKFNVNNNEVDVLNIRDNLDAFVQKRADMLASAMNQKSKNIISLEDVASDRVHETVGSIIYIPVGKTGENIIQLPFSCKDNDATVEGQCIGYMAIGQSGSGKSSFFHSIVLNGCKKYSPRDLQFWLLDFKHGGASSKYSNSGLQHIRIIAENNKVDDALCLFQMILEEMERRQNAFNVQFVSDIIEYNEKAKERGLEHFPRIIIAIDEIQEIFRDENASVLQKQISSISTRMRSVGMHFIMVAQNLSEGKSYMLKDAFLPSATGRICFRVGADIPRESGFGEEFIQRKNEITELKTGEAYVSYGKGTIKKVKMAFVSPDEMSERYFDEIRNLYSSEATMKPLVIGSKKKLTILSLLQGSSDSYFDVMSRISEKRSIYKAIIAEDVYRMAPLSVTFSQIENSSMLLFGSDKLIASSLCTSIALSLARQNVKIHLFNGDRVRIQEKDELLQHPFMYVCQNMQSHFPLIRNYRLNQLKDIMIDFYKEYLRRQELVQKAEDDDPVFEPEFLIVNDLFGIECFKSNEIIVIDPTQSNNSEPAFGELNFGNYDIFNDNLQSVSTDKRIRESLQTIMDDLLNSGYRYNLYVILHINNEVSSWRGFKGISSVANIVLFNSTDYASQMDNSYYLKEMLKNISGVNQEETLAVWKHKKVISKIRPIIYDIASYREKELVDSLLEGR